MNRKTLTIAALIAAVSQLHGSLILTGIIDGPLFGGTPKGIELYVTADIADLSEYGIELVSNNGSTTGIIETAFSGSAVAGQYLYVASEAVEFANVFGFAPDFVTSDANHNGDDDFYLYGPGATLIDVWGGSDGVDNTATAYDVLDSWAYRLSGTGPSTTFDVAEWTISPANSLDGLTAAQVAAAVPFGTYTGEIAEPIGAAVLTPSVAGGNLLISMPTETDVFYRLQSSTDLGSFANVVGQTFVGTGAVEAFAEPLPATGDKAFYQVVTGVVPANLPPAIVSISEIIVGEGDVVTLTGENLASTTAVAVGATPAPVFSVGTGNVLEVTIPAGASTGNLEVTNPDGSASTVNLVVVTDPALLVYSQDFTTGLDDFTTFDVASTATWAPGTFGDSAFVQINGFGADLPSDDWLISPAIDLTTLSGTFLLLGHERGFDGPALEVKVSTNYAGGDPALATWTDLVLALPLAADFSNAVTDTGMTDLSAFDGQTIHVAIRYTSTDTIAGTGARDRIHYFAVGGVIALPL